jgi:hypothetical protein
VINSTPTARPPKSHQIVEFAIVILLFAPHFAVSKPYFKPGHAKSP